MGQESSLKILWDHLVEQSLEASTDSKSRVQFILDESEDFLETLKCFLQTCTLEKCLASSTSSIVRMPIKVSRALEISYPTCQIKSELGNMPKWCRMICDNIFVSDKLDEIGEVRSEEKEDPKTNVENKEKEGGETKMNFKIVDQHFTCTAKSCSRHAPSFTSLIDLKSHYDSHHPVLPSPVQDTTQGNLQADTKNDVSAKFFEDDLEEVREKSFETFELNKEDSHVSGEDEVNEEFNDLIHHRKRKHEGEIEEQSKKFEIKLLASNKLKGEVRDPHQPMLKAKKTVEISGNHKISLEKGKTDEESSTNLAQSKTVATQRRLLSCQCCDFKCRSNLDLISHTKNAHQGYNRYNCTRCDLVFSVQNELKRHCITAHTNPQTNKRKFASEHGVDSNIKNKKDTKEFLSCHSCEFYCRNERDLMSHLQIKHKGEDQFRCKECSFRTSIRKDLIKHVRVTHIFPFECDLCGKKFSYPHIFQTHMATHSTSNSAMCHLCGKGFKCKKYLSKHIAKTHAPRDKHLCAHCGEGFRYRETYLAHLKLKHPNHAKERLSNPSLKDDKEEGKKN